MKRLPIIGVVGSHREEYAELTGPLGKYIAKKGFHLLTGGGNGVMSAIAKSFTDCEDRKGLCIGVIPIESRNEMKTLNHYTNPYIELPIITQLDQKTAKLKNTPMAFNMVNILSSDVIIVLPGLTGTKAETSLAIICEKPVILFGHSEDFDNFPTEPFLSESIEDVDDFVVKALRHKSHPKA